MFIHDGHSNGIFAYTYVNIRHYIALIKNCILNTTNSLSVQTGNTFVGADSLVKSIPIYSKITLWMS